MWTDPIIEELREIRRAIAAESGNDLAKICAKAREWEQAYPERLRVPTHVGEANQNGDKKDGRAA